MERPQPRPELSFGGVGLVWGQRPAFEAPESRRAEGIDRLWRCLRAPGLPLQSLNKEKAWSLELGPPYNRISVVGPPWRLTQQRPIYFFLASLRR